MAETYRVHDEENWEYLVMKGDPAYPMCRQLEKAGFTRIVLPRDGLVTGAAPALDDEIIHRANNALAAVSVVERVDRQAQNRIIRNAERQLRLVECMEVLLG